MPSKAGTHLSQEPILRDELATVEKEVDHLLWAYDKIAADIQREPNNNAFISRLIFRAGILYSALMVVERSVSGQEGTNMLISKLLSSDEEGELPEPEKLHFAHNTAIEYGTSDELAEKLFGIEVRSGLLHSAGDSAEKLLGRPMFDEEVIESVKSYLKRGTVIGDSDSYITSNVTPLISNPETEATVRHLFAA